VSAALLTGICLGLGSRLDGILVRLLYARVKPRL